MTRVAVIAALAVLALALPSLANAALDARGKDRRPPRLVAATVNGSSLVLRYDERLAARRIDPFVFEVKIRGEGVPVRTARSRGFNVHATLARTHLSDDPVTLLIEPDAVARRWTITDRAGNLARRVAKASLRIASGPGCSWRPAEAPWPADLFHAGGRIQTLFLFVGYRGWPAGWDPAYLFDQVYRPGLTWFREVSYERVIIEPTVVPRWHYLDRDPRAYPKDPRAFLTDVAALLDPVIDFSRYGLVVVVVPNELIAGTGRPFLARPGDGIRVDGAEIRHAVVFSADSRLFAHYPGIVVERTSLLFGARQLHAPVPSDYWAQFRPFGGWDPMSYSFPRAGLLAWQRLRLGWLTSEQVRCHEHGSAEYTLTPLWSSGGPKTVMIPTGPSSAYFVESADGAARITGSATKGSSSTSWTSSTTTGRSRASSRATRGRRRRT